jgi:hypothetical protein
MRRKRGLPYTGEKHGRLTISCEPFIVEGKASPYVIAECSCGSGAQPYIVGSLTSGNTSSCGCLERELTRARSKTHDRSKTTENRTWSGMKQRVLNPDRPAYRNYGARGIDMDPRWIASFEAFLADMGEKPSPELTIERIDNDRGYWPDNCKWVPKADQTRNSRKNVWVTLFGEEMILAEAERRLGLTYQSISKTSNRHNVQENIDRYLNLTMNMGPNL